MAEGACLVLGMHRSGTSAVTRVLNILGLELSREHGRVEGPANPKGFWESHALFRLNEELLNLHGGSWDVPPAFPRDWQEHRSVEDARRRARATLADIYPAGQWVWKDPRNCLTLPFWLELLPPSTSFVFVHRNPLEVARSLLARNPERNFSLEYGIALWERYARSALSAVEGRAVFALSFPTLLADPSGATRAVACFLERQGFRLDDPRNREINAFLDESLRHKRATDEPEALSAEQRLLHERLAELDGAHARLPSADLGPETTTTEALFRERRLTPATTPTDRPSG